ncbi:hypothetical protein BJY52DRAFT_1420422 [Lactarius psammicola]|nr:hypothetical protein BJY52DRAFT_1420422 [Lactarius psammicola]
MLHALSATAPIRHKVDIKLRACSLRLAHATGAPVAFSHAARAQCLHARSSSQRAPSPPVHRSKLRCPSLGSCLRRLPLFGRTTTTTALAPERSGKGRGEGKGEGGRVVQAGLLCPEAGAIRASFSTTSLPPHIYIHIPISIHVCAFVLLPPQIRTLSTPHQALVSLLCSLSTTTPTLMYIERGALLAGIITFRGARETTLWSLGSNAAGGAARILADPRRTEFWPLQLRISRGATRACVSAAQRAARVLSSSLGTPAPHQPMRGERRRRGRRTRASDDSRERERGGRGVGAEAQVRVWDRRCAGGGGAGAGAEGGVVERGDSDSDPLSSQHRLAQRFKLHEPILQHQLRGQIDNSVVEAVSVAQPSKRLASVPSTSTLLAQPTHAKRERSPSPSPTQASLENRNPKRDAGANQREEKGEGEKDLPHLTLDARPLHPEHSTTCALVACSTQTRVPLPDNNNNNDAGAGAGAERGAAKEKEKGNSRFGRACSVPEAGMFSLSLYSTPGTPLPPLFSHAVSMPTTTTALTAPKLIQVERGAWLAGITAFRGAGETSLCFFHAASAISEADPDKRVPGRVPGACASRVGRRVRAAQRAARPSSSPLGTPLPRTTPAERSEEDEGEETVFQLIDGMERKGIAEWARKQESAFGIADAHGAEVGGVGAEGGAVARGEEQDFEPGRVTAGSHHPAGPVPAPQSRARVAKKVSMKAVSVMVPRVLSKQKAMTKTTKG